jgi:hypothetical protein
MENHYIKLNSKESCKYFIMNPIHNNFSDIKKFNKVEMKLNFFNEIYYEKISCCFEKDLLESIKIVNN